VIRALLTYKTVQARDPLKMGMNIAGLDAHVQLDREKVGLWILISLLVALVVVPIVITVIVKIKRKPRTQITTRITTPQAEVGVVRRA